MIGRDDAYVAALERAHQHYLEADDLSRAAYCGVWIGHSLHVHGHHGRATGWFARSQRILDDDGRDCVGRGYLKIPEWLSAMRHGRFESAYEIAGEAAEIARRFADVDLLWLTRDDQARALFGLNRPTEALRLVDEALVAAAARELSPIVTGIVYCNTIGFCRANFELRRVREWTEALTAWCARQPEMIAHNGPCLVHQAECLLLAGQWQAALDRATRCVSDFTAGALNELAQGEAYYCQGEVHRLRGDSEAAEAAYRRAGEAGREPQPGLALMRLAEARPDAAVAVMRRLMTEVTAPRRRAVHLPAFVEIMVSSGSVDSARAAARELDEIAQGFGGEALAARAAYARGIVALSDRRAAEALPDLRRAFATWEELGAPYESARVRLRIGQACQLLNDEDTAAREFDICRRTFTDLGARCDAERVAAIPSEGATQRRFGLTGREAQVLKAVAAGRTNREIAAELFISEHTVARHVQNIFTKLNVTSRTAAAAFAFEHRMV
jgi:DNA-binding CsgD family transcriptional regulator